MLLDHLRLFLASYSPSTPQTRRALLIDSKMAIRILLFMLKTVHDGRHRFFDYFWRGCCSLLHQRAVFQRVIEWNARAAERSITVFVLLKSVFIPCVRDEDWVLDPAASIWPGANWRTSPDNLLLKTASPDGTAGTWRLFPRFPHLQLSILYQSSSFMWLFCPGVGKGWQRDGP